MPPSPYEPVTAIACTYVQLRRCTRSTIAFAWKWSGATTREKYSKRGFSLNSLDDDE